jgi:hypothetical protein
MSVSRSLKTILFIVFVTSTILHSATAQEFQTSISSEKEMSVDMKPLLYGSKLISYQVTNNKMQFGFSYKLFKTKFGIKVMSYNSNYDLVKETELSNGERAYGPFHPSLQNILGKLYLFYYQLTGESDTASIKLMAAEIDTVNTSILDSKQLLLLNQQNEGLLKMMGIANSFRLKISTSADKTKVLITWAPGVSDQCFYSVLDRNLKLIQTGGSKVADAKNLQLNSTAILNNGSVFLGLKCRQKAAEYAGYIITVLPGQTDKVTTLSVENLNPYEVLILPNEKNDKLQVAGTYVAGNGVCAGVYSFELNTATSTVQSLQKIPFTDDLLQQLHKKNWSVLKGEDRGMNYVEMETKLLNDGSYCLIGELYKRESFVGAQSSSVSIYGDIIGAYFKGGQVTFFRVPKYRRSTVYDVGAYHNSFVSGNRLIVFYNDKEENLDKSLDDKVSKSDRYDDLVLVAATVENGKMIQRVKVIDLKKEDYLSLTNWILQGENQDYLVPFVKIKSLGRVDDTKKKWALVKTKS